MLTEFEGKFRDSEFYYEVSGIRNFSLSVLTENAILKLKKYAPILEVGSGIGYWAYEFQKRNIPYKATDIDFRDRTYSWRDKKPWADIEKIEAKEAVKKYQNYNCLLFCWPDEKWAIESLKVYRGEYVVYCYEEKDGFYRLLEKEWDKIEIIDIPQWRINRDRISVYKRRS